jgi:hypothetical protein
MSSAFQRLMSAGFNDIPEVVCYLDNIWIVTNEGDMCYHYEVIQKVIARLNEVNIRLNPDKCTWMVKQFKGLGHLITPDGIEIDPQRRESIMNIPRPKTYADLYSFLGLANQVRDHIRHYSNITSKLNDLLKLEGRSIKAKPSKMKSVPWDAIPGAAKSFELLQHAVATAPMIRTFDSEKLCILMVDASTDGVGSALYQVDYVGQPLTQKNLVSFRSHALKGFQKNYAGSPFRLELHALVTALEDYRDFLWGKRFIVYTDHKALTYMYSNRMRNRYLTGCWDVIQDYEFEIIHIPGLINTMADALSRAYPHLWGINYTTNDKRTVDIDGCDKHEVMLNIIQSIPQDKRDLIDKYHNFGHFGAKCTVGLLRDHDHTWTGMYNDVKNVIDNCTICQRWTITKRTFESLRHVTANLPFDHIQVDLLTNLGSTPRGHQYCLVVVDVFTGYVILEPMKSKSADELFERLWSIFRILGVPKIIQSDNEKGLIAKVMQSLYTKLKMHKIDSTPYNHRANGKVESMIRWVSSSLQKVLSQHGGFWDGLLADVMMMLNQRISTTGQVSPFLLMFNRPFSVLDSDVIFPLPEVGLPEAQLSEWRKHQNDVLHTLFPLIQQRNAKAKLMQKKQYETSRKISDVRIPNNTIVMLVDERRNSKNEPKYTGRYIVMGYDDEKHTYLLKDTVGHKLCRNVKRDMINPKYNAIMTADDIEDNILEILDDRIADDGSTEYLIKFESDGSTDWVNAMYVEDTAFRAYHKAKNSNNANVVKRHKRNVSKYVDTTGHADNGIPDDATNSRDESLARKLDYAINAFVDGPMRVESTSRLGRKRKCIQFVAQK